ncbi:uncharacterized protein [Ptychodera flava]|uniref:uncharacterized protein n=1 Tax=Ptychodera flava TaxID=63121 RepID=UPI003969DE96
MNGQAMITLLDSDLHTCVSANQDERFHLTLDLGGFHIIHFVSIHSRNRPIALEFTEPMTKRKMCVEWTQFERGSNQLEAVYCCANGTAQYVEVSSDDICEIEIYAEFVNDCAYYHDLHNQTLPRCNVGIVWWDPPSSNDEDVPVNCNYNPGDLFPIGVTSVQCTYGNSSCAFEVTIEDRESPEITSSCCDKEVKIPHYQTPCMNVSWEEPTSRDNSNQVVMNSTASPGACFPKGTTEVTYTFHDPSANHISCSFSVTVQGACSVYIRGTNSVWNGSLQHGKTMKPACRSGWKTDEDRPVTCDDGELIGTMPTCVDVDECAENTHSCDVMNGNEYCENSIGSHTCHVYRTTGEWIVHANQSLYAMSGTMMTNPFVLLLTLVFCVKRNG